MHTESPNWESTPTNSNPPNIIEVIEPIVNIDSPPLLPRKN